MAAEAQIGDKRHSHLTLGEHFLCGTINRCDKGTEDAVDSLCGKMVLMSL